MPLQLDAHVATTKETDEPIEQPANAVMSCIKYGPTGQRHEAGREAIELFERERSFSLGRAQLHARHEATEVLVALGGGNEDRQTPLLRDSGSGTRDPGLGIRDSGVRRAAFLGSSSVGWVLRHGPADRALDR